MNTSNTTGTPMSKMPEYALWKSLKHKCLNPNAAGYARFGGCGKTFAPRWQGVAGFEHFLTDVGRQPFPKAGLELIDSAGNCEPGNVRWADTRPCRLLTHDGRTMSLVEWAQELNIRPSTLRARLHDNLPPEQVFARSVRRMHMKPFRSEARQPEYDHIQATADSEEVAVLLTQAIGVMKS